MASPEMPSVGTHRAAASGDRRPRVLRPAWATSRSLTKGEEQGWGGTQKGAGPPGRDGHWGTTSSTRSISRPSSLLPSSAGKPRSPPGRAPSAQVGNPFTASLNALLPISLPPLSSVRGQPSAFQRRTSGVPRAPGHRPPPAPSPRRRGCPQLGSPRAPRPRPRSGERPVPGDGGVIKVNQRAGGSGRWWGDPASLMAAVIRQLWRSG